MLWTPRNSFNSIVSNWGSTYTAAGLGTTITPNASANTKGSTTQCLSALADSCYFLDIAFTRSVTAATAVFHLVDIMYDPAGGTNWQVLIPNLLVHNPALGRGMVKYAFPIFMPAGSTVGARAQASTGGTTIQVCLRAHCKPTRPELVPVGSKVTALGVNTATSSGTAITPGTGAFSSYTSSLGTLPYNCWWWQAGFMANDTTITSGPYVLDVAINATNKIVVLSGVIANVDSSEQCGKDSWGDIVPIYEAVSGEDVYMRCACQAAPDSSCAIAAYALGG